MNPFMPGNIQSPEHNGTTDRTFSATVFACWSSPQRKPGTAILSLYHDQKIVNDLSQEKNINK
jgi:hypothetical protein